MFGVWGQKILGRRIVAVVMGVVRHCRKIVKWKPRALGFCFCAFIPNASFWDSAVSVGRSGKG